MRAVLGLDLVCGYVLLAFSMAFLGSMLPAGPTSALVLERGISRRLSEGLHVAVGGAAAEAIYCAMAASSVGAFLRRTPAIESIARVVSMLALLGLGVYFLRAKGAPISERPTQSTRRAVFLGWSAGMASPMAFIAWSVVIGILASTGRFPTSHAGRACFVVGVFSGVVAWFALLLLLLRRFQGRITVVLATRLLRMVGALLTLASALIGVRMLAP